MNRQITKKELIEKIREEINKRRAEHDTKGIDTTLQILNLNSILRKVITAREEESNNYAIIYGFNN